jgi:hypothetical protein
MTLGAFTLSNDMVNRMNWLTRYASMFAGVRLMAQPLSTFADVLPFSGNLGGGAATCLLLPIALALSLMVITAAWIAYRPMISIPLLVAKKPWYATVA